MVQGLQIKMLNTEILLLVIWVALSTAIRVDFGTKPGPIVPAVPTTAKPAQQPYRNPAPVWEDQSNDIPNPNPYQYVLPPPSQPKPATNNYKQSSRPQHKPRQFDYGKVLSPDFVNSLFPQTSVSAFSPQFIPNFGFKYHAIVPSNTKTYYTKTADTYYNDKFNKFNGKYNAKTKKYKAYEKAKYTPNVFYSNIFDLSAPSSQQQLPLLQAPQPFRMPEVMHPQVAAFRKSTPKVIYSKDDLYSISKNYNYKAHPTQNSFSYESNKIRR